MDYENKYKEALATAKHYYEELDSDTTKNVLEEIFPELKESEDEKIRKEIIRIVDIWTNSAPVVNGIPRENLLAWLEKQGEHANFRNKIQIGDKVTRNEDGVLVNLSQLKRVAKSSDKIEPKFHEQSPLDVRTTGYWHIENAEQKSVEWSEEDESYLNTTIAYLKDAKEFKKNAEDCIDWLKSLKDRYKWKPSDEQIEILEHFVRSIGESGYASPYDNNTKLLYSLLSDLKKLKG